MYELIESKIFENFFHFNPKIDSYDQNLVIETTLDLNLSFNFNFGVQYSLTIFQSQTNEPICIIKLASMYEVQNEQGIDESVFMPALVDTFSALNECFITNAKHEVFKANSIKPPNYEETLSKLKSGLISQLN